MSASQEHLMLLAEVAVLYYEKGMTQGDIAAILDVSRSTVSRLLDESLREKIVEITIHFPWRSSAELSARLEERFRLRMAYVLTDMPDKEEQTLSGLGALASRYLCSVLRDDSVIGASWGRGIYHMVKALRVLPSPRRQVVQIVGVGNNVENSAFDAAGLVQLLTEAVGGSPHYLYAPRIVEDESVRDALMKDASIQDSLERARHADVLLTVVRGSVPGLETPDPTEWLAGRANVALPAGQPVGEICGRPFNVNGAAVDNSLNRRVVGIDLDTLRANGHVVALAAGRRHALALLGALRGGFLNIVVTDERTARWLLELDHTAGCSD